VVTSRPPLALLSAAACVAGLAAVAVLALLVPAAHVRDAAMLHGFRALDRPRAHETITVLAHLADPVPYMGVGLILVAVALARRRGWRALAAVVLLIATGVTTQILKQVMATPRFEAWLGSQISSASWPSGHSTAAMTLALCAVMVAPPALRAATALVGGAFAIGVGYAVLVLAWHFPSDVLGGYLVAGAWVSLALAALPRLERARPEPAERIGPALLVGLGGGAALVVGALASARGDAAARYAMERPTLVVGAMAIAALALALVATISAASGRGAPRAR
jgi:membrane-associated phospholipid phosphatase